VCSRTIVAWLHSWPGYHGAVIAATGVNIFNPTTMTTQNKDREQVKGQMSPIRPTAITNAPEHAQGQTGADMEVRSEDKGPNPGPGVTSQGHRVSDEEPPTGNERDAERNQPGTTQGEPSPERPRDQDKDRQDPLVGHNVGDEEPERGPQAGK
jgi:hypothetical protein